MIASHGFHLAMDASHGFNPAMDASHGFHRAMDVSHDYYIVRIASKALGESLTEADRCITSVEFHYHIIISLNCLS